jgi:tetratricopeptide (TPR) repeat protein
MTPAFLAFCLLLQSVTPEVIEHAQAGEAAARQGRVDVAIQEFRKVIELQPNSAVYHAHLGYAYFKNGQYEDATTELKIALRLNPDMLDAHQSLGAMLLIQGNAEEALPHLEKIRSPDLLGLAYLETGRLPAAVTALRAALDRQPNDPNLLYYFGRATALASKRTLNQVAKLNPDLARTINSATNSEPRSPHDVVTLQDTLAKNPNDVNALSAFSQAAAQASKQAFDQILQSNADSARAHQVLADRYVEDGRLAEAEREYVESLKRRPNTSNVHLALGNVLAAERKWPLAVAQYRIETQLQPASAEAFYTLGSTLLQQGQARGALEQLTQADRLKPDAPQILLELGRAAFAAQDSARAEACWIKLLDLDSKSRFAASAHLGLSALYRQTGRVQEADRETAAYEKLASAKDANTRR